MNSWTPRVLSHCSRCLRDQVATKQAGQLPRRRFSQKPMLQEELERRPEPEAEAMTLDPRTVHTFKQEKQLKKFRRLLPIGSRRRRLAIASTENVPFSQLPYQCFQEARKVLAEHRREVLHQIATQQKRVAAQLERSPDSPERELAMRNRIAAMEAKIKELKIEADIHDPLIKKSFEDGHGDMNLLIYRHLAEQKWRNYPRKIVEQRITQMNVVPDVIPHIYQTASVDIRFPRLTVKPGQFVDAITSQFPPTLHIQLFEAGKKLFTIVAVDSDVPDVENDRFNFRCHGIFANITLSPTDKTVTLNPRLVPTILPWLPPYAQKGSPYHRISLWLLEQPNGEGLDGEALQKSVKRDKFIMRSFIDKHHLKPVGVNMFRCIWDSGTAGVMEKHGIPGADVMLKRKTPEKMPYKKKDPKRYR